MAKCTRRRCVILWFQVLSIIIVLLTVERMVFDTFGQMWGTMILNCMTALCTLTGIVGVCINEKMAIGVFSVWNILSIGLNLIVIFIYKDVGLLSEKEHYLGLSFGNDNWWRTHGIGCESDDGSGDENNGSDCVLSYAAIETIHAAVYMVLSTFTLILSLYLLCVKKKPRIPGDDESFNFVSVSHYDDYPRPHRHFRKWSYSTYDTSISLW